VERVIFYLCRQLLDVEIRYPEIEKLCLCLYFSCTKLRHYLLANECLLVCKADVVKYILLAPVLNGRLAELDLRYESAKTVNGQVVVDLLVEHSGPTTLVEQVRWTLFFDGLVYSKF
jgi:hypothetical protein